MSTLAAQKQTAHAVVAAYNAWDMDAMLAFRASDCQHQILPASLGRQAQNNEELRKSFSPFIPLFSNFTLTVLAEAHDAEAHTSVLHARSTAETKIGPYANEYALILKFTEDGKKVIKFDEFVDSAYTGKFITELVSAGMTGQ